MITKQNLRLANPDDGALCDGPLPGCSWFEPGGGSGSGPGDNDPGDTDPGDDDPGDTDPGDDDSDNDPGPTPSQETAWAVMQQLQRAGEASVTEYMQLLESMSDVAGWEEYYSLPIADQLDVSMQSINYREQQQHWDQGEAEFIESRYAPFMAAEADPQGWNAYYSLSEAVRKQMDISQPGINYWEGQQQLAQQDAQFAAEVEKQQRLASELAKARAAQQAAASQRAESSPRPGSHAMDKLRREGEEYNSTTGMVTEDTSTESVLLPWNPDEGCPPYCETTEDELFELILAAVSDLDWDALSEGRDPCSFVSLASYTKAPDDPDSSTKGFLANAECVPATQSTIRLTLTNGLSYDVNVENVFHFGATKGGGGGGRGKRVSKKCWPQEREVFTRSFPANGKGEPFENSWMLQPEGTLVQGRP